jgi:hypothetical protein
MRGLLSSGDDVLQVMMTGSGTVAKCGTETADRIVATFRLCARICGSGWFRGILKFEILPVRMEFA